ncbi:hypothetical protein BDN72DRAFT_957137 [Pluteus cervinus]|uniref:Uncharacterized protein n=1 Tax=Pluteus cervinus TaxID=181527 RepID=A0ACD3B3Q6_9AGAR|nr:hypothetical protein BDN72DRAFT_957137 [Pluteus cervinus]
MTSTIDADLGALLIGGLIAMAVWGVTCVQVYTYFNRSSSDRFLSKGTTAFLFFLNTLDSAFVNHFLYYYLVTQFGNPDEFLLSPWSGSAHNAVAVSTGLSLHLILSCTLLQPVFESIFRMVFAHRVYMLSNKNIILNAWIMVLSFVGFVVGVLTNINDLLPITSHASFPLRLEYAYILNYLDIVSVTLANFSITIALCYLLHRSRTGFRRTNSIIRVLIMYTVNTGGVMLFSSLLEAIDFAFVINSHTGNVVYGIAFIRNGMYLSSYLAGLNAREGLRDQFREPVSVRSQLGLPMAFAPGSNTSPP